MQALIANRRMALGTVIALGTALRVALFLWAWNQSPDLSTLHYPDTISYIWPAESLLHHGRFYSHDQPEMFRTPGYSLLLLPGLAIHQVEVVTFCIQLILSVATIWLVYRTALDLFGDPVAALGAGLLMAIEPLAIIFTSALLSETLFTFLFMLFLRYLLRYLTNHSLGNLTVCGLLLAAATFVRPVTYYLPAVLIAGLLARAFWLKQPRIRLLHCGVFAAAALIPIGAWQMRNDQVADYPAFSASGDFNLYFHHAAWAVAHRTGQTLRSVQDEFGGTDGKTFDIVHPELRGASRAERYAFMGREGKRIVRQYFPDWVKVQIRNALMIALNPGGTDLLKLANTTPVFRPERAAGEGVVAAVRQMADETPILFYTSLALGITVGSTYVLSALGWLASFKRRPWEMVALLGIAGYLTVTSAAVVEARLRHPIMPILCLLGGAGIVVLQRWAVSWRVRDAETELPVSIFHGRIGHLSCAGDSESLRPFADLEAGRQANASRTSPDVAECGESTRHASGTEAASADRRQATQQPGQKALS